VSKDGHYVAVYDITDNRERRKVDRVLSGYGFRVQKSVFECRLTKATLGRLTYKLEKLNIKTGGILIYRLNKSAKCLQLGVCSNRSEEEAYAFII
jgi:CRISPR-associated protein Cas2